MAEAGVEITFLPWCLVNPSARRMGTDPFRKPRSHRLFLALWPDEPVRRRVARHAKDWVLPADCLRYQPADWHVTLHFLGSVAAGHVPGIADGVDLAFEPFELVLDQPQLWPRGLAVLGASKTPTALRSMHTQLGEKLGALEQRVEARPYRPHLTLARRATGATLPTDSRPVAWRVRRYALVVSTGSVEQRYVVLREYG